MIYYIERPAAGGKGTGQECSAAQRYSGESFGENVRFYRKIIGEKSVLQYTEFCIIIEADDEPGSTGHGPGVREKVFLRE